MSTYFDSSAALKLKPFAKGTAAIIGELSNARVLEEEFLLDPAGYLTSRLLADAAAKLPRQQLNSANRLLFSIMSNEKFVGWIKEYQDSFLQSYEADPFAVIDKDKVRADLARAMIAHGDSEIINAILPGNLRAGPADTGAAMSDVLDTRIWIVDVAVEIEVVVYAVAAAGVFALVVAIPALGAAHQLDGRPALREMFVGTREMSAIAEALVRVGSELRARGHI